jgi:hypothetical protein
LRSAFWPAIPGDRNATFATVPRLGLYSDYAALVEKRHMASLAAHPDFCDACVAIGVENYLLSLGPAPVRRLL